MPYAMRIHTPGGTEAMVWEEVEVGSPGPGQVRLRHTAVGLNFIDVYHRTGLYPQPLPFTLGLEAAGVVEEVGEGVTELKQGDRVAYCTAPIGAYSEARLFPAERLVKLPDWLEDRTAAAMMLQGMTVQYLLRRTYPVQAGQTILIHAAAGGVGLIACQWAKALGCTVIGTVGSEEKAELARANGCDHPVLYREENVVERVKEITGGKGVPVVYDGVGKDMFETSLDCLAPRGMMVSFGNASGPVPPFSLNMLAQRGGLFITRPSLANYTSTRQELVDTANDLFAVVQDGRVKIDVRQTYPLREAAQAHRDLEARKTTGSTVLLP
ncbi:quinone oxidoreductase family protein [Indioceanicola profundi]|uniref:quinone oxidoreductase family protein n=1 Tax=Indioceanicola profundi TaxID=2220096 RepID=UPI000E6AC028|nr:quinone oxidoreductase [Indioceanicola profundi]